MIAGVRRRVAFTLMLTIRCLGTGSEFKMPLENVPIVHNICDIFSNDLVKVSEESDKAAGVAAAWAEKSKEVLWKDMTVSEKDTLVRVAC